MKKNLVQKVLAFPFSVRQRTLSKNRSPLSKSDFVDSITQSGGDQEAAEIVHSRLQDWIYYEGFTAYPDDSLSSVFGIAEEELDEDLILDIFMERSLSTPSQQEVTTFDPIDSPTGVAQLVAMARSNDQNTQTAC